MINWPDELTVPDNEQVGNLLQKISSKLNLKSTDSEALADYLDQNDPFKETRNDFEIPRRCDVVNKSHDPSKSIQESTQSASNDKSKLMSEQDMTKPCLYFCGNSLGLMPKITKKFLNEELDVWASRYVTSQCSFLNL